MPIQCKHYIIKLKRDNEVKLHRDRTYYVHDEELYDILLNIHFRRDGKNIMNYELKIYKNITQFNVKT